MSSTSFRPWLLALGLAFPISASAVPLNRCDEGPILLAVSDLTYSSLTAQFHGNNVFGIDYAIHDSNGALRANGNIRPENAYPGITFPELSGGTYRLTFSGSTCYGESSIFFELPHRETTTAPPIVEPEPSLAPCRLGPTLLSVSDVHSQSLTAEFHGLDVYGISYRVYDSNQSLRASGDIRPENAFPPAQLANLTPGQSRLEFHGNTCPGQSSFAFTVPGETSPPVASPTATPSARPTAAPPPAFPPVLPPEQPTPGSTNARHLFLMNLTTGFFEPEKNDGIYISDNAIEMINRAKEAGLDGIRLSVRWGDFEKRPGVFEIDKLRTALRYIHEVRGFKVSAVLFFPWRFYFDSSD